MLPVRASIAIEFVCVVIFCAEIFLKYKFLGKDLFFRTNLYIIQIFLITADVIGLVVSARSRPVSE